MDPEEKPDPDPGHDHVIQDFDVLNQLKVPPFLLFSFIFILKSKLNLYNFLIRRLVDTDTHTITGTPTEEEMRVMYMICL